MIAVRKLLSGIVLWDTKTNCLSYSAIELSPLAGDVTVNKEMHRNPKLKEC